jgi:hypothetical protein
MAGWITQICRPIANVTSVWNANTYANIDDAVLDPAAGDGVTITANASDDNETQSYKIALPVIPVMVDLLTLEIYSKGGGAYPTFVANLIVNGVTVRTSNIFAGSDYGWTAAAVFVTLNMGQLGNQFQLDFVSPAMASEDYIYIDVAYVTVRGWPMAVQIV